MPSANLSAAIKEAYASAPSNAVIYETLELYHPLFSVPIRVVRDNANLDAKLEATAPRDAGEVVTFAAYAFSVVPPQQTADGLPQVDIEIDNVSQEIIAQIEIAVTSQERTEVIYRQFLADSALDGPENDPPLTLDILTISANPQRIKATAGYPNLLDLKFPAKSYDLETFPGLAV